MKKFQIKSLILGLLLGIIGTSLVLGASKTSEASTISSLEKIESAAFSNSKVYFYGKEISLKNPLVIIRKDGSSETQLYMPMRELLEYMQFNVEWNSEDSSVNLTMNGYTGYDNHNNTAIPSTITKNEADIKALDIIQKTGNWQYIEPYLPHMSTDAIEKVVEIYNSKHINSSEHKKASDYIKK
ncbi:hypothetical protein [Wukongibacter sp. M2B1]|uniref:hypothetical protein n=1 Tax=Wukongibacter sp. M2B1 TaxID=3088895 RepID=UPI003D7A80A6